MARNYEKPKILEIDSEHAIYEAYPYEGAVTTVIIPKNVEEVLKIKPKKTKVQITIRKVN